MACFVPFNNRNLDISFLVFRPTVVFVDELVEVLKTFSVCTQNLGCVQSSILRSIHGNMIIWYGAWMKRCSENKEMLTSAVLPLLSNISGMAILLEHIFFETYAGESREGICVAKFSTGDIVSMNVATPTAGDLNDLCYANLALFRDHFLKMEGAVSGVCLKCQNIPRVACFYVWKSMHFCYSWILTQTIEKQCYRISISLNLKSNMTFSGWFLSAAAVRIRSEKYRRPWSIELTQNLSVLYKFCNLGFVKAKDVMVDCKDLELRFSPGLA
ncbi:hypothetical protein Dsin_033152 [Dipteronia sinensis]|uniref:DUF7392 domain-containing protein n=1 Tax=Dipteronia sinensis TaxID=43782 RepID=A0AAE0DKN0_9ROSI|nr:hypothetical protein Dsin_033152 [Dipteronia sinensis]